MTAQVLLHPRYWRTERPVTGLRDALAEALATEAEHYCHRGPELAARYWSAFGDLELAWQRGAGEAGQQPQLAASRRRFHDAWTRLSRDTLDPCQAAAFLADYRKLVRALHPEVVSDAVAAAQSVDWPAAQAAFYRGDAVALRTYADAIESPATEPLAPLAEYERLQTALADARVRLEALRARFPFNLQAELGDPDWIAAKRGAMQRQLAAAPAALGRDRLAQVS